MNKKQNELFALASFALSNKIFRRKPSRILFFKVSPSVRNSLKLFYISTKARFLRVAQCQRAAFTLSDSVPEGYVTFICQGLSLPPAISAHHR